MSKLQKIRVRSSEPSGMERVGWVATALATLALLAMIVMLLASMAEIKRYLKIESM